MNPKASKGDPMSGEACPIPSRLPSAEVPAVDRMLQATRIAIVGMSDDPMRPSNGIGGYLKSNGFDMRKEKVGDRGNKMDGKSRRKNEIGELRETNLERSKALKVKYQNKRKKQIENPQTG